LNKRSSVPIKLAKVLQSIQQLLSPKREQCLSCKQQAHVDAGRFGFCDLCFQSIPWVVQVLCPICGRYEACSDCNRREISYFAKSRSAVRYDDTMKELLARYKYRGDERLKPVMGTMLTHAFRLLQEDLGKRQTHAVERILTYVPVSEKRMQERGFNQAEQMARELGRIIRLPVIPLLQRARHTEKQSFKSRNERLDDLQHVFQIHEVGLAQLAQITRQRQIYMIDDVYTTGSTMNQCAKVLKEHLDEEVFGLTWAR
jgi:competence protein ComFC